MRDVTSRKRMVMLLPFQVIVLGVLVARGAPPVRIAIQIAAYALCLSGFMVADRVGGKRKLLALLVTLVAIFVSIGNTGGLASPLLLMIVPFLFTLALHAELSKRERFFFLGGVSGGLVTLAVASNSCVGQLFGPLAPRVEWASSEYVALALVSGLITTISSFKMGRGMSSAYERIALELAVRREELCDESEGRTRALEGIAARLAHEVKNPLAAIKGLSTHVARNATDAKVKERLTIVAAEAERLQEIVEGFLSFSRGLDDLSVAPTRPYDIARELALLLETRAADAGVTIEVRGSRELTLNADNKKLRQALLNLVLNAMQASSRGAIVTMEIAKSYADGAAQIKVLDRGAGMTPDILDRIRKPYFTTKEGGSGLGIAVARGIIEQHGGTLRFDSTSGRGTTATVILPACAYTAQGRRQKLPNPCMPHREREREREGRELPVTDPIELPGAPVLASAATSSPLLAPEPEKVPT
jgi:signal transduction histidine kinase